MPTGRGGRREGKRTMATNPDYAALLSDRALPTFGRMKLHPVRFDAATRRLSASVRIGVEFAGRRGFVSGGFFAALLDDVMTAATMLTLGGEAEPQLITHSTDYLAGAPPGDFAAEAWVISVGAHHCLTKAQLRAPSGEMAAIAQGVVARNADEV